MKKMWGTRVLACLLYTSAAGNDAEKPLIVFLVVAYFDHPRADADVVDLAKLRIPQTAVAQDHVIHGQAIVWIEGCLLYTSKRGIDASLLNRRGSRNTLRLFWMQLVGQSLL